MNAKKIQHIQSLFNKHAAIVNTSTLKRHGIHSRNIAALLNDGFITRIKQGHYVWNDEEIDRSEIVLATKLIPNGVLCLYTAIEQHQLSTVNPTEIFIALPRGSVAPTLPKTLKVNVRQMSESHFKLGISEMEIDGVSVKIYDIEKTVCDCFKYDKEVEQSVAIEVLKNYMKRKDCNLQKLFEYAEIMGKKNKILPYVVALI